MIAIAISKRVYALTKREAAWGMWHYESIGGVGANKERCVMGKKDCEGTIWVPVCPAYMEIDLLNIIAALANK